MSPENPGAIFTDLVLEIFKVSGYLSNEGDELTKEFGLTSSRWKIMGAIEMSPVNVTVPQIARSMGQSRQAVQRLVDVMAKDGMVAFKDNPNHKRAKYVLLSEEAKKTYEKLYSRQIPWAEQWAENFDPESLESALKVLKAISKRHTDQK